jgi:hypothetical protein
LANGKLPANFQFMMLISTDVTYVMTSLSRGDHLYLDEKSPRVHAAAPRNPGRHSNCCSLRLIIRAYEPARRMVFRKIPRLLGRDTGGEARRQAATAASVCSNTKQKVPPVVPSHSLPRSAYSRVSRRTWWRYRRRPSYLPINTTSCNRSEPSRPDLPWFTICNNGKSTNRKLPSNPDDVNPIVPRARVDEVIDEPPTPVPH